MDNALPIRSGENCEGGVSGENAVETKVILMFPFSEIRSEKYAGKYWRVVLYW